MSNHTPTPWKVDETEPTFVCTQDGQGIADVDYSDDNVAEDRANAARIVACVNACEGINPEAVPDFLAACEAHIATNERAEQAHWPGYYEEIGERLAAIRAAVAKARKTQP